MKINILHNNAKILLALLFGLGALLAIFMLSPNANAASEIERLKNLELQTSILAKQLNGLSGIAPKEVVVNAPIRVAQTSRNLATVNVRLAQLEEQIRILTGQVEGLQFQMTQMQTFLERQQEDYEFRFEQLEGGGSGKAKATSLSEGAMPVGEMSQNENSDDVDLNRLSNGLALDVPTEPLSSNDINISTGNLATRADADAQYNAGYEAALRGDIDFAKEQFRQFISLYPTHPQAPDATDWLGGELIKQGSFQEAADILLSGFQSYSGSKRAPDLLFKLGQALAGAGEHATACRTFEEVTKRYPDISNDLKTKLATEQKKAKC